jgi:hypothetical protein
VPPDVDLRPRKFVRPSTVAPSFSATRRERAFEGAIRLIGGGSPSVPAAHPSTAPAASAA